MTLLPIALGYHFAHYLVTFMVQIKYVLSTLSDPLAQGWNLFGLGAVKVTIAPPKATGASKHMGVFHSVM